MNTCPSLLQLTSAPLEPDVVSHVADCVRCTALLAAWTREVAPSVDRGGVGDDRLNLREMHATVPAVDAEAHPRPGAVHAISVPTSDQNLVCLITALDRNDATVVPVSPLVQFATDEDILLDQGVLGYCALIMPWNRIHVLREQVNEQLAVVPDEIAGDLLAAATTVGEEGQAPGRVRRGPRVLSDTDPRIAFHDDEAERVRPYAEPWKRLHAGASLGSVLRAARAEAWEQADAAAEHFSLKPRFWADLEDDRLDLFGLMPIPTLSKVVTDFGLLSSRRLDELVFEAALANDRQQPFAQGAQFNRRRRGMRQSSPLAPEDIRREHAGEYVAKLRKELER